jgi:hypothetical protein
MFKANNNENRVIRTCGSSFAYCNGNCSSCEANNTYATTSTDTVEAPTYDIDAFCRPSKEAYEKAKMDREYIGTCLNLSRKRKNELIDELCKEREAEKFYMEMYEKHREIIRKYEIYEELDNES